MKNKNRPKTKIKNFRIFVLQCDHSSSSNTLYLDGYIHELVLSVVQPQEAIGFLRDELEMKGLVGHHLHHLGGVDTEGAEVVVDVGAAQEADSVCGVAPGLAEHLSLHILVQVCVDLGLGGGYGC